MKLYFTVNIPQWFLVLTFRTQKPVHGMHLPILLLPKPGKYIPFVIFVLGLQMAKIQTWVELKSHWYVRWNRYMMYIVKCKIAHCSHCYNVVCNYNVSNEKQLLVENLDRTNRTSCQILSKYSWMLLEGFHRT